MREISTLKYRILQFLESEGITKYECYKNTGITNGVLSQSNGLSEDNIMRFLSYYKNINPTWFLTGEGHMLLTASPSLPQSAVSLPATTSGQPVTTSGCPPTSSPCEAPVPSPPTTPTPISSAEAFLYKMYKEKDEEVKALTEQQGILKHTIQTLEEQISDQGNPALQITQTTAKSTSGSSSTRTQPAPSATAPSKK